MPQDDSYGMGQLGWLPEFFPVTGAQVNAIRFPKNPKSKTPRWVGSLRISLSSF